MFVLGCYRLISWNTFSDLTFQFCCCPSIGSISNPSWSKFMLLWQKLWKYVGQYMYTCMCSWPCPITEALGQMKIIYTVCGDVQDLKIGVKWRSAVFRFGKVPRFWAEWKLSAFFWMEILKTCSEFGNLIVWATNSWTTHMESWQDSIIMVILTVKEVVVIIIAMILIITLVIIIAMIRHTV